VGRLARTVSRLHPLQIAARVPHALVARALPGVTAAGAPALREAWPPPSPALRGVANAERTRGADRLSRLPAGSRLRAYESCYGLELGADDGVPAGDWRARVAVEPFPASVRARRIAVAVRCGRPGLGPELARAARAVLLQPELHLLGNHLLENGFALACSGAAARGAEADVWWAAGCALLAWQLPAQFLADGGHVERSASYHAALTAGLLETIELADASGREAPDRWRLFAARALGWLLAVRAPDGTVPLFNDAALDAAPAVDDVLSLGRSLGLQPAQSTLDATGWVRLDVGDACLIVDAGPDAAGWQPGHAHADGLTFELWVRGERAVVDYGVESYEPGEARTATRATRSHNTAEVDGLDSCEVWGAFRVGRRGTGRVIGREATTTGARLELEHDGYAWLPGRPRHRRSLDLARGRLDVSDAVPGSGSPWASRMRLASPLRGTVSGAGEIERSEAHWFPRHGEPAPAVVLTQRAAAGAGSHVRWSIRW
jgi:hypothetical protein